MVIESGRPWHPKDMRMGRIVASCLCASMMACGGSSVGADADTSTTESTETGADGGTTCGDEPVDWGYELGCMGAGWRLDVDWKLLSSPACPERSVEPVSFAAVDGGRHVLMRGAEVFELHRADGGIDAVEPPPELAWLGRPAVAIDLDGDGWVDLVTASRASMGSGFGAGVPLAVAWGRGDGVFDAWQSIGETAKDNVLTSFVYDDGSGSLPALVEGPTESGFGTKLWRFPGRTPEILDLGNLGGRVLAVGDVDGDGMQDIVTRSRGYMGAQEHLWLLMRGTGPDSFAEPEVVGGSAPAIAIYQSNGADIDGDGDIEVVISKIESPGLIAVYDWAEHYGSFLPTPLAKYAFAVYDFDVVDADADGIDDIFFGGYHVGDTPNHELGVFLSSAGEAPLMYSGSTSHRFALRSAGTDEFRWVIGDGPAELRASRDTTCE